MSGFFRDELDEFHNVAGNKIFLNQASLQWRLSCALGKFLRKRFVLNVNLNLDILYRVYMFTNSVQKTSISSWLSNKIVSSNAKLQTTFVSLQVFRYADLLQPGFVLTPLSSNLSQIRFTGFELYVNSGRQKVNIFYQLLHQSVINKRPTSAARKR